MLLYTRLLRDCVHNCVKFRVITLNKVNMAITNVDIITYKYIQLIYLGQFV